jgi:23S rRNA (adenine-N6)-dimethyltransferase
VAVSANNAVWQSQNFIRRVSLAKKIVRLADFERSDLVVEIGPGKGILTRPLAEACSFVIAVEYDRSLCRHLIGSLGGIGNVKVVCADFRQYDLPKHEYRVFASIPFNITSDIVHKLTAGFHSPKDAYLIMQAEAARRFAGPPCDHESLKSLLLKPKFESSILHRFRDTDFWPTPKVDSVLLRMARRRYPVLTAQEDREYRDFLCFVFSEHGADIGARLGRIFTRPQLTRLARDQGFALSARIVDLSFAQWLAVFRHYLGAVAGDKQSLVVGAEKRLSRQQAGLTKIHRSRTVRGWKWTS